MWASGGAATLRPSVCGPARGEDPGNHETRCRNQKSFLQDRLARGPGDRPVHATPFSGGELGLRAGRDPEEPTQGHCPPPGTGRGSWTVSGALASPPEEAWACSSLAGGAHAWSLPGSWVRPGDMWQQSRGRPSDPPSWALPLGRTVPMGPRGKMKGQKPPRARGSKAKAGHGQTAGPGGRGQGACLGGFPSPAPLHYSLEEGPSGLQKMHHRGLSFP